MLFDALRFGGASESLPCRSSGSVFAPATPAQEGQKMVALHGLQTWNERASYVETARLCVYRGHVNGESFQVALRQHLHTTPQIKAHIPGSKDLYVALFNLNEQPNDVAVSFASLGVKGKVAVRDLWKKADVGAYSKSYHQTLPRHGAALLRLTMRK